MDRTWTSSEEGMSGRGRQPGPAGRSLSRRRLLATDPALRMRGPRSFGNRARHWRGRRGIDTRPALRFHGAVPALVEEVKQQLEEGGRVLVAGRIQGRWSAWPICSANTAALSAGEPHPEETKVRRETAYFAGEVLTATPVKADAPDGVTLPEARLAIFGAHDLFDEADVVARPQFEIEDLRISFRFSRPDGGRRRYAVQTRRTASRATRGCGRLTKVNGNLARLHYPGVRRGGAAVCAADAAGSDPETPGRRRRSSCRC